MEACPFTAAGPLVGTMHQVMGSGLSTVLEASICELRSPLRGMMVKARRCRGLVMTHPFLRGFWVAFLALAGELALACARSCKSSFMRCLYLEDCRMRLISCKGQFQSVPHARSHHMLELYTQTHCAVHTSQKDDACQLRSIPSDQRLSWTL